MRSAPILFCMFLIGLLLEASWLLHTAVPRRSQTAAVSEDRCVDRGGHPRFDGWTGFYVGCDGAKVGK